jgi:hypothetical protein
MTYDALMYCLPLHCNDMLMHHPVEQAHHTFQVAAEELIEERLVPDIRPLGHIDPLTNQGQRRLPKQHDANVGIPH